MSGIDMRGDGVADRAKNGMYRRMARPRAS